MRRARLEPAGQALLLLAGLYFLWHAPEAGLHLDDHGFHHRFADASWSAIWDEFWTYVPGRNLYVLFYAGLYRLLGDSPRALHSAGLALDLANAGLFWLLLKQLGSPRGWALALTGLFLVWPNHGETHYWTAAIAMNLLSTSLILLAFLAAGAGRLGVGLALWAVALFTYDQAFLMWLPILLHFRSRRREAPLLVPAVFLALVLNLAHVALRALAPSSSGGRPVILWANLPRSFANSFSESLLPLRNLPPWGAVEGALGGPWATVLGAAALATAWVWLVRELDEVDRGAWTPPGWLTLGPLWFLAAYFPNYFWYISPRHNYLPSAGLLIAAAGLIGRLPRSRAAELLAAAGFGLFGVATLAEGRAWRAGAELQRRFREAASDAGEADSVFIVGAPASVLRAPAFAQPQEAAYLYGQATGRLPERGGLRLSPSRSGVFLLNEVELFGRESLAFAPYEGLKLFAHEDGRFFCAARLRVSRGGRAVHERGLPGSERCGATVAADAPVWLESAEPSFGKGAARFTARNGASLLEARLEPAGADWLLALTWRAERAIGSDFAAVVSLLDEDDRVVYEPIYRVESMGRREPPSLWPAFNDLRPPSSWRVGSGARELYRLRRHSEGATPRRARLVLFERGPGVWTKIGEHNASL